jgi:hypothetical protein
VVLHRTHPSASSSLFQIPNVKQDWRVDHTFCASISGPMIVGFPGSSAIAESLLLTVTSLNARSWNLSLCRSILSGSAPVLARLLCQPLRPGLEIEQFRCEGHTHCSTAWCRIDWVAVCMLVDAAADMAQWERDWDRESESEWE